MIGEDTEEAENVEVVSDRDMTLPGTVNIRDMNDILTLTGVDQNTHANRLQSMQQLINLLPAERLDGAMFVLAEGGNVHHVKSTKNGIDAFPVFDAILEALVEQAAQDRGVSVGEFLDLLQSRIQDGPGGEQGQQPPEGSSRSQSESQGDDNPAGDGPGDSDGPAPDVE